MAAPVTIINHPDDLEQLANQLQQQEYPLEHLQLGLLHPLGDPQYLTSYSVTKIRIRRNRDDFRFVQSVGYPYVNLEDLCKRWRAAWKNLPTTIKHVSFDIALPPRPPELDTSCQAHYYVPGTNPSGFRVEVDTVKDLVSLLAGLMHVRSNRSVRFTILDTTPADKRKFPSIHLERMQVGFDMLPRGPRH